MGENLVDLRDRLEVGRLLLIVDEQRRANPEKEDGHRHAQQGVGPDRLGGFFFSRRGEVTLHDRLVGAVTQNLREDTAEDDHPDRVDAADELPVGVYHLKFTLPGRLAVNVREAAINFSDDDEKRYQRAADEDDRLDDIRPDDRLDASQHGVDGTQHAHGDDAVFHVPTGHRRQRQCR